MGARQELVVPRRQVVGPVLGIHLVEVRQHRARWPAGPAPGRGREAADAPAQDLRTGQPRGAREGVEQLPVVGGQVDLDRLPDDAAGTACEVTLCKCTDVHV